MGREVRPARTRRVRLPAGHGNNDAVAVDLFDFVFQAPEACYAAVFEHLEGNIHEFQRTRGFPGDEAVCGSGGNDSDTSLVFLIKLFAKGDTANESKE